MLWNLWEEVEPHLARPLLWAFKRSTVVGKNGSVVVVVVASTLLFATLPAVLFRHFEASLWVTVPYFAGLWLFAVTFLVWRRDETAQ